MTPAHLNQRHQEARDHLLANNFSSALARYEKLIVHAPAIASIWVEYGNAAAGCRRLSLADRAWRKALELAPNDAELVNMIGHQYQSIRLPDRARACYAQAASADPRAINPRISLAVLSEQQHLLEKARSAVDECLRIDPGDDQARFFSAVLDRRANRFDLAESRLRDLIASDPRHPFVRYAARYELAQLCDRTNRLDEAVRLLSEAKAMVRSLTNTNALIQGYDLKAARARSFVRAQPKTILQTWAGYFPERSREKIQPLAFLGGHPRSGTTLLEQILGAHPGVAALDEPTAFIELLEPAFHKTRDHSSARINALRRLYIEALVQEAGPASDEKLLIDKNPSPTARLPVWLRVFPELKVLIALRDPRDVVLSCYFQNIPLNAVNVNFLSFERTAKHYSDLMDIWLAVREWQGFNWAESRYEDTVADMESEGRRVTTFLGLAWDEQQTRFYEKSRTKQMYSPTYQDVTRPVYKRSVARWHAYQSYLEPIFPILAPYCRSFGYS
jgi:tetratricopeptide (TPR) repeat protein